MKNIIIAALIFILIGGLAWYFAGDRGVLEPTDNGTPATSTPSVSTDLIIVDGPAQNALISSPVLVSGRARGNWYFEASFPVEIVDAAGKRLAIVPAQAEGEWMTTEFVPFSVSIPFSSTTAATGTIILHKDNPSGLPEFDRSVSIPVRFR